MEKFLGILFAGGKGTRLGIITEYIPKSFVPVYDRPVFIYPLKQLQSSRYIDEIVILARPENYEKLEQLGYVTIMQDDRLVKDMFSGLRYIKKRIKTDKHYVLMPCDNLSNIKIDRVIKQFLSRPEIDILFCIKSLSNRRKLKAMGVYDLKKRKVYYKPARLSSKYGVLAPYIVRNSYKIPNISEGRIFNQARCAVYKYRGWWFDIGDLESLYNCSKFLRGSHVER